MTLKEGEGVKAVWKSLHDEEASWSTRCRNELASSHHSRPRAWVLPRYLRAIVVCLLGAACFLDGAVAAYAASSSDAVLDQAQSRLFATIDADVRAGSNQQKSPGVALGIVKGNKIVHLAGFGHADDQGRAATAQTPFYIGSVSKSFTALAVMQLVEAGKVELDQPVRRYIPWFQVADPVASQKITVASLLNHTSGLPDWFGYFWKQDSTASALESGVRSMRTVQPTDAVGQKWQYSNANFTILGLVVQSVSRQPYESYVQDRILTPLGMTNTYLSVPAGQAAGLATEHRYWFNHPFAGGGLPYNRAITPTGLIMSDAQDMSHYLIAQLNGGRFAGAQVLSPAGIAQLHAGTADSGGGDSYAMGWKSSMGVDGRSFAWHDGNTGGSYAYLSVMPQTGWGLIYLSNGSNDFVPNASFDIAKGVMARLLMGHQPAPPPGFFDEPSYSIVLMMVLLVGLLQVAGVARSILLWRRWSQHPERRPHRNLALVLRVVAPLALNLLWAALCLVAAPTLVAHQPLEALVHPPSDWATTVLTLGGVALIWGVVLRPLCTLLMLRGARIATGLTSETTSPKERVSGAADKANV